MPDSDAEWLPRAQLERIVSHLENRDNHKWRLNKSLSERVNWTIAVIAGLVIGAFFALKRLSFISADAARKNLAQGALVIDVRSPEEFRSGHLPNAVNIPLGELRESLPRLVKDKGQVLLLHCLSGGRSGIAKQQLASMGYTNVFNLGSLARARRIAGHGGSN
jgi:phage shock protein E